MLNFRKEYYSNAGGLSEVVNFPVYLCINITTMHMEYWEFYNNGGDTDDD